MLITSVIVVNFDLIGISVVPDEADAPLVIDPDAVVTRPVAAQLLQSIAGQSGQVTQFLCTVELTQFALRSPLNVLYQPPRKSPVE